MDPLAEGGDGRGREPRHRPDVAARGIEGTVAAGLLVRLRGDHHTDGLGRIRLVARQRGREVIGRGLERLIRRRTHDDLFLVVEVERVEGQGRICDRLGGRDLDLVGVGRRGVRVVDRFADRLVDLLELARVVPHLLGVALGMTSYLVEQGLKSGKLKPTEPVTMSLNAWCRGGKDGDSCMFVPLNAQASLMDMLRGVVIDSGNDASKALAEHIGGSESGFAALMNAEAAKLGMTHTHFENSAGLPDPHHKASARDLAVLAQAIIRNSAEYYPIYAEREFTYNGIKQGNRNALLYTDPTVDGLKTGHTEEAGYCLTASAKPVLRKGGTHEVHTPCGRDHAARRSSGLYRQSTTSSSFLIHPLCADPEPRRPGRSGKTDLLRRKPLGGA